MTTSKLRLLEPSDTASSSREMATMREQLGDLVAAVETLRAREAMALQERNAQKLQGIGQIAAGVAHEINTPLQFIGDNLHIVRDGVQDLMILVESLRRVHEQARRGGAVELDVLLDADSAETTIDCESLGGRMQRGFDRAFEGLGRISGLVEAMKRFAHPRNELAAVDINRVLETTLAVARNEYKHVADLVCDLEDVPPVLGYVGDLGQVFLNLIVNAAHAIADLSLKNRGVLTVRTRREHAAVVVTIADTGCGIDPSIRDRVFEPFFTTKEPGRGTGQGLAIVHTIIHDRHHGAVWFESTVGRGTEMHVRLPLAVNPGFTP